MSDSFRDLSRAAAKAASAKLRKLGALPQTSDWAARAAVCERCRLRVIHKGISFCGTPFLNQIQRDPAQDGCGCPTRDKARDPSEHCPLDPRQLPATRIGAQCTCKWCAIV